MAIERLRVFLFGSLEVWRGEEHIHLSPDQSRLLALLCIHRDVDFPHMQLTDWLKKRSTDLLFGLRKALGEYRGSAIPKEHWSLPPQGARGVKLESKNAYIDLVEFSLHLDSIDRILDVGFFLKSAKLFRAPLLDEAWKGVDKEDWVIETRRDVERRFWGAFDRHRLELANSLRARALVGPLSRTAAFSLRTLAPKLDGHSRSAQKTKMGPIVEPSPSQRLHETKPEVRFCEFLEALGKAKKFRLVSDAGRVLQSELQNIGLSMPARIKEALLKLENEGTQAQKPLGDKLDEMVANLIDRDPEMDHLTESIVNQQVTIVAGALGLGKTCLAKLVGQKLRRDFAHGVCYVHLEETVEEPRDKNAVAKRIQQSLGITPERGSLTRLLSELAKYPEGMLLILDGCETATAECARVILEIGEVCPRVRILATSRERFPGMQAWSLPRMKVPPSCPWEEMVSYSSVRLFLRTAEKRDHAALPRNEATAAQVARILELTEGIPLAIVLVAARWPSATLEAIIADLEANRLDDNHEKWLRGLIGRSKLSPVDWIVFRRIGVFKGGFTIDAVVACAGEGMTRKDISSSLARIAEASLIDPLDREQRYSMSYHIRALALTQLDAEHERDKTCWLHFGFYARLAREASTRLFGSGFIQTLNQMDRDEDNLVEALQWASRNAPAEGLSLTAAIWPWWVVRGQIVDGRKWLLSMRWRSRRATPRWPKNEPAVVAGWSAGMGILAYYQSRYEKTIEYCEKAARLASKMGPRGAWLMSLALNASGVARFFNAEKCREEDEEDRSLMKGKKMIVGSKSRPCAGDATRVAPRVSDEQKKAEADLKLALQVGKGEPWLESLTMGDLALVQAYRLRQTHGRNIPINMGRKILRDMERAIVKAEETDNDWLKNVCIVDRAAVLRALGRGLDQAEKDLKRSLRRRYDTGDRYGMIQNIVLLACSAAERRTRAQLRRAAILLGGLFSIGVDPESFHKLENFITLPSGICPDTPNDLNTIPVPFLNWTEFQDAASCIVKVLEQRDVERHLREGASLPLSSLVNFGESVRTMK